MAITINDVIYRNIQEQVAKNKSDIAAWTNVQFTLNNLGITVLGRVDAQADIPEATYSYGDAYLVGESEPYDIYIFTRDDEDGSFINMGPLSIVGPQGPTGEQGPAGTISIGSVTTGAAGSSASVTNSGTSSAAILNFTIPKGDTGNTGPAGEKGEKGDVGLTGNTGPQGPQGDPGESFMIIGTVSNVSQLPDPLTTPRNYAYIYSDGDPTTPDSLYYITGAVGSEVWSNSSFAAAGTTVSVDGNPVSEWNANTKQDAPSAAGTAGQILGLDANGDPEWQTPSGGVVVENHTFYNASSLYNYLVANAEKFINLRIALSNNIGLNVSTYSIDFSAGTISTTTTLRSAGLVKSCIYNPTILQQSNSFLLMIRGLGVTWCFFINSSSVKLYATMLGEGNANTCWYGYANTTLTTDQIGYITLKCHLTEASS